MMSDSQTAVEPVFIPPSTVKTEKTKYKRQGSARKGVNGPDAKRSRRNSWSRNTSSSTDGSPTSSAPADLPLLDGDNPIHVNKMSQRRKEIAKGKNTLGYARYTELIPIEKRKPFSMETPATPDHRLDIPNKRWNGMVKAWRKALHRYDPPDMVPHGMTSQASEATGVASMRGKVNPSVNLSQEVVIDVKKSSSPPATDVATAISSPMTLCSPMATASAMDEGSPLSVLTDGSASRRRDLESEFKQEEQRTRWGDMSDSDDDDELL